MADKHNSNAEKADEAASGNAVEIIGDACPRPEYRILSDRPDEFLLTMGVRDEPEQFPDGCGPDFESAEYTVPYPTNAADVAACRRTFLSIGQSRPCSSDEMGGE